MEGPNFFYQTQLHVYPCICSQWLVFILDKWVFFIESYHHPKLSNRCKFFGILLWSFNLLFAARKIPFGDLGCLWVCSGWTQLERNSAHRSVSTGLPGSCMQSHCIGHCLQFDWFPISWKQDEEREEEHLRQIVAINADFLHDMVRAWILWC